MAAHHTTPKSGVVLGYDREASDSHAAYLRGACYALEHRVSLAQPVIKLRQQAATGTDLADLSRNGQRFQAIERALTLPEPATVSRRPATGIAKRFSLRQSARVGYVETRPSLWQAGHVTNFGSSSSNQERPHSQRILYTRCGCSRSVRYRFALTALS